MKDGERLFSYIVKEDCGLAPNPYWEYCTLAVCKPQIRARAQVGDLIVGLAPSESRHALVYVMRVSEVLSFGEYFNDRRFKVKIPDMDSTDSKLIFGDNFYELQEDGDYRQVRSSHSHADGREDTERKRRDISGRFVLVGETFSYLGNRGEPIPPELSFLSVGRGHRSQFTGGQIEIFNRFLEQLRPGINGQPRDLEKNLRWLERIWKQY